MLGLIPKTVGLFLLVFFIMSCKNAGHKTNGKLDLLKYGIPVSISAPKDAEVSKVGKGTLAHVSVKNEKGYDIQVFMADAVSQDMIWLKQQKKEMVTVHPNFTKIVEEYDNGFVYEKTESDGTLSYDFVVIQVLGDKEISFMGGNTSVFTEANVKDMVSSIQ